MKRNSTPIIIIIVIVLIIGLWIYIARNNNKQSQYSPISTDQTSPNTNNATSAGVLFSSSPMAQNAYLISTPTYDAKTDKALSGFKVVKTDLADGSIQYVLNSSNTDYTTQTYIVKPGEKLYFIESTLSDDNNNQDKFTGDDTAVVVDANGYIVNQ
jgi:hypothetical protein